MKSTKVNKDIYNIISSYFRGKISEQEETYLQNWLVESSENKEVFNELKKVWELTGELSSDLTPDIDSEWDRFVNERDKNNLKTGRIINFRPILRIAAVLIPAFIIISAALYYISSDEENVDLITLTTIDNKEECLLSDGSKVWINKNSEFIYPEEFSNDKRVVNLKGEAFFDVAKGQSPFIIKTTNTQITVLGTAFNVRAVEKEKFVEVIVNEGTVLFTEKSTDKKVTLNQGEKGTFDEVNQTMEKGAIDDYNSIGWKNEKLSFTNTPLINIESTLERYFDIEVELEESMKQCKFTGDFKDPHLEVLLEVISTTLEATYQIKNDTVFIEGLGCN